MTLTTENDSLSRFLCSYQEVMRIRNRDEYKL
jgi:hypothetical protein